MAPSPSRSGILAFSLGALGLLAPIDTAASFAVSSSSSPKRRQVTNQGKAPGGFAKRPEDPLTHARDDSAEMARLVQFLRGWKSEGVGPGAGTEAGFAADGGGGGRRGVFATRAFKKGDILCKIPSDCALALADPGSATDGEPTVVDGGLNLLRWYQQDERARGLWSAYLDTLPTKETHFDPTPDFYSEREIEQLQFPSVIDQVNERKRQIAALAEESEVALDELQFATWLASSRSFPIKMNVNDGGLVREGAVATSERVVRVLLPYLDLINHSSDHANAELHLIDPERDDAWFAVRATRPVPRGREVVLAYGTGAAASPGLFRDYGFVPDENRMDALLFRDRIEGAGAELVGRDLFANPEAPHWSTTLEEDEALLAHATDNEVLTAKDNMVNILKLRVKVKRAHASCTAKAE